MYLGQRYIILIVATAALVVLVITSAVVVNKRNTVESKSYLSSLETKEPTVSPMLTTSPSYAPSLRPSIRPEQNWTYQPSNEPTIGINGTETFFPTNLTTSPAPSDNSTLWPSLSPLLQSNSSMIPSLSPSPTYWNDSFLSSVPSYWNGSSPGEQSTSTIPSIVPTVTGSPSAQAIQNSTRPSPPGTATTRPVGQTTASPTATNSSGSQETPQRSTVVVPESASTLGTRFYAIGDVPYTRAEAKDLKVQIANIPQDAEFVIHVGDIRTAKAGNLCTLHEYHNVAAILNQSHAPVFIILGGAFSILLLTSSFY